MKGVLVNTIAIILGSILGLFLKGGIPEKISKTLIDGLALCVLVIGISGSLKSSNTLLIIISIVIGGFIGELIDIDRALIKLGDRLEKKFKGNGENEKFGKVSEGFVTASLLFCVGAMAIVGSIDAGLSADYKTLYIKSMLDGVSSIIFASTLGIGVMLSAVAVFIYQGSITLLASLLSGVLVESVILDITAIGSILIIGIGLNMLKITKLKLANYIPAIFIPIIYYIISNLF
ncbi:MAG: DUF554 domain-containing protein [Clostridiaceae bacterium]